MRGIFCEIFLSIWIIVLSANVSLADESIDCSGLSEGKMPFEARGVNGMGMESLIRVFRGPNNQSVQGSGGLAIQRFKGPFITFSKTPGVVAKDWKYTPDISDSFLTDRKNETVSVDQQIYFYKSFSDAGLSKKTYRIEYNYIGSEDLTVSNCSFPTAHFKESYLGAKNTDYDDVWNERWYSEELRLDLKSVTRRWYHGKLETVTFDIRRLKEVKLPSKQPTAASSH